MKYCWKRHYLKFIFLGICLQLSGCWTGALHKYTGNGKSKDLTELAIEELMDIEFVTIFKKPEKLFESPAAVYALSGEEIERAGAIDLPDALRMVPGLQVAEHNASSWAITMRGFSGLSRGVAGQFANKLLVLADGRSVYTPLFSGVSWETQNVLLDDVDRLEVIRGPGAALWGANAVNGIINIISKNARDTQGAFVSAGVGTEQRAFGHARYGGKLSEKSYYRLYLKYLNVDGGVDSTGRDAGDSWHILRGGFRVDSDLTSKDALTLQGETYDGKLGQRYFVINSVQPPFTEMLPYDTGMSGGHILGKWQHQISQSSFLSLQAYFDRVKRNEAVVKGAINTFDVNLEHRFRLGSRQEIIWGVGYRLTADNFDSTLAFYLSPGSRNVGLFSAFIQNEIELVNHNLYLTLGSKFEKNQFTGFEMQPNFRLLWMPAENHAFWGAYSRAVRTPSRAEEDARIILQSLVDSNPTTFLIQYANPSFLSEVLQAFEAGYRVRPNRNLFLDFATFYNRYNHLQTDELETDRPIRLSPSGQFVIPQIVENGLEGKTFGFELAAHWQPLPKWRVSTSYSYLKMLLKLKPGSKDLFAESAEGQSPQHQLFVRSSWDLPRKTELDLSLRFVDSLPAQNVNSYITSDVRIGWHFNRNFELELVGQNLLQQEHWESSQLITTQAPQVRTVLEATQVQRGAFTKITWRF